MRRVLICMLALAALGACKPNAPAQQQVHNPQDLHVEIGRYGVMLNQAGELTAHKPGTSMADPADPKQLARALRETVWRYNAQRSDLCGRNLYAELTCGPALEPVWLSEPA